MGNRRATAAASVGGMGRTCCCCAASLNERIGHTGLPLALGVRLWTAAFVAAAVAWGVKLALPPMHPICRAALILVPFGLRVSGIDARDGGD